MHEIRRGYRSDVYFWRSKVALEKAGLHTRALMQVFQKKHAMLCGVDEVLAILKLCTGHYIDSKQAYQLFDRYIVLKKKVRSLYHQSKEEMLEAYQERLKVDKTLDELWQSAADQIEVNSLRDGDEIEPWETVVTIAGPLSQFIHLETIYLGILARRTRIATNVNQVVKASQGKPVLYFPARFDHWFVQGGDGYAAKIGGATAVSTDAQGEWWGASGAGTIPHALIAVCGGDTVKAAGLFIENFPKANMIALVDFHNDCVRTSLEVARAFKEKLWGVRLDTAETMVDKSLSAKADSSLLKGVNPGLVENVRQALDRDGFKHVKIIVSGGFTVDKIGGFEKARVPVDAYGVGSALMQGSYDFTADVVQVAGRPVAKVGRRYNPNSRLRRVCLY